MTVKRHIDQDGLLFNLAAAPQMSNRQPCTFDNAWNWPT
jgi:hypothetical protein